VAFALLPEPIHWRLQATGTTKARNREEKHEEEVFCSCQKEIFFVASSSLRVFVVAFVLLPEPIHWRLQATGTTKARKHEEKHEEEVFCSCQKKIFFVASSSLRVFVVAFVLLPEPIHRRLQATGTTKVHRAAKAFARPRSSRVAAWSCRGLQP